MFKEFREFAMKGSLLDMAVGIVLGIAFGAIVASLVKDVIMPPVGMLLGNVDFSNLRVVLREGATAADTVAISYGLFINAIINFVIVAFAMFLIVRSINRMRKPETPSTIETKVCPFCATNIAVGATRCPNCTSELTGAGV